MKLFQHICFLLLASGFLLGQNTPVNNSSSDDNRIADQIKVLQDAIAGQQQQIESLRQELAARRQAESTPHLSNASLVTMNPSAAVQGMEKPADSPLSFRIGGTEFTPGGFVDFTNIFRSTNTGSAATTSFGAIPFSNTPAGHLSEYRATGQYSRANMKITGKYGANNITAFMEADFNGNDAANVFVGTNPHTLRLRLFWLNVRRGQWEFLGGQSWGLLTPNRNGVSPLPADLSLTFSEDANIHVGLSHTRQAAFRAVWHPNDHFAWAFGVENPEQFTNGEVTVPVAFGTALANQLDGLVTPGVPNAAPDIVSKLAWDTTTHGRKFHVEAGGIMTTAKVAVIPTGGATAFNTDASVGGAAAGAVTYEFIKNVRVVANGMYGTGIGRYLTGLGPQYVVRPVALSATSFEVATSMVHSGGGLGGFEFQASPKTQIGTYYGAVYFQRNAFADITSPAATKPIIGFGGAGSANTNNRDIQQASVEWLQTFWKSPQYGSVVLQTQGSYLTRSPWFVAPGAPKNAHLVMAYVAMRYLLP